MIKSADAFRTIREVSDVLSTPAHVLRFWESKFSQIKPIKRAGGRRYYRRTDVELIAGIKKLLHEDGITIRGVQKILRERGVKHIAALQAVPEPQTEAVAFLPEKTSENLQQPIIENEVASLDVIEADSRASKMTEQQADTKPDERCSTANHTEAGAAATTVTHAPEPQITAQIDGQISLFSELPLSPNPVGKKEKVSHTESYAAVTHASTELDIVPLGDKELVPEIATRLAQNSTDLSTAKNSNRVTAKTNPGSVPDKIATPSTSETGPLYYLASISDLRPGQKEALPKLRDRLSNIFPNAE